MVLYNRRVSRRVAILALVLVTALVAAACSSDNGTGAPDTEAPTTQPGNDTAEVTVPEIPQVKVNYGHEPYFDHTQAIIGMDQGWFEELGITFGPEDTGIVVPADQGASVFASGRLDVFSGSAQLLMPGTEQLPAFKLFFLADLFKGFAIMAQPDGNYTSFSEFVEQGRSPEEAYEATMEQLKGKVFAFPPESAIKGFIDLALQVGGVTLEDMETQIGEDTSNVRLMESGRADFQVGGVPSRITLELQDFKAILTSGDLAQFAEATPDSKALRAVFHDGWLASDEFIANNRDTILRMASVGFRINQMIVDQPEEAMAIHTPFLNSAAGTDFTVRNAEVAYEELHPFFTFEQQEAWLLDRTNPLNQEYVIGSAIRLHEEEGTFEPGQFTWEDYTIAHDIYSELLTLRAESTALIDQGDQQSLTGKRAELLKQAKYYWEIFDFLDAKRFAEAAIAGL